MKKFIVVYHAPEEAMKQMADASEGDMKESMEPWMAWAKKCGDALVDLGTPLGNSQMVTTSGSEASKSSVVGYSILQAENMDGAVELLKDHPHLAWTKGCEIEVHEALPLPGME